NGLLGERRQQVQLEPDAVDQRRLAVGERVLAPRLAEALDERLLLRFEEDDAVVHAQFLERRQAARKRGEEITVARVDAHRDPELARKLPRASTVRNSSASLQTS